MDLLLGVLADGLVRVEETRCAEEPYVPAVRGVAGDGDRAIGERLGLVVELGEVDVGHAAHALAARTHAAGHGEGLTFGLAGTALDGDRTGTPHRRDVEGERFRRADVRLPEPAEEDPQHRVGVGGGADGGAGVGAHPLLVDDDRGGQSLEHIDLRPRQLRHEALEKRTVGLVDQPLRLRGDRAEHQRALARAGDAGEHRQPALRDHDVDVLEVVHTRALHADQIVAVGNVQRGRLLVRPRGHTHRVSICRDSVPLIVLRRRSRGNTPHGACQSHRLRVPYGYHDYPAAGPSSARASAQKAPLNQRSISLCPRTSSPH